MARAPISMMYSAPGGRSSRRAATLLALALLFLLALLSTGASSMTVMLRVAFQPDLPPYQFVDAYGRAAGAHIDILNSIARRYNMQVEYVPMNSNTACLEAPKSEQVDAVLGIHNGVRHDDSVRLTTVISQSQVCIVAPSVRAREIREPRFGLLPHRFRERPCGVHVAQELPESLRPGCATPAPDLKVLA